MSTDTLGNIYITGGINGTVDFDPGPGVYNLSGNGSVFFMKLDPAGNFIWARTIGSSMPDSGVNILPDDSGNVYITGTFGNTIDVDAGPAVINLGVSGADDVFIIKYDINGNYIWATSIYSVNGNSVEDFVSDGQGNFIITGGFQATTYFGGLYPQTSFSSFNLDTYVAKMNAAGTFLWSAKFGGAGANDVGYGLTVDNAGNILTVGAFQSTCDFDPSGATFNLASAGSLVDIFICKLDANGNFIWAKRIGNTNDEFGYGIDHDNADNIYVVGKFKNTVDFDPNAGVSNLVTNAFYQIFILKITAAGNFIWAKDMGASFDEVASSVKVDDASNVYLAGTFNTTMDVDPGIGVVNLVYINGSNYIVKLDSSANYILSGSIGGFNYGENGIMCLDKDKNILIHGAFQNTCDFDPSSSVYNMTAVNSYDMSIVKLKLDYCTNFKLIVDTLQNISCSLPGYAMAYASTGVPPYSYSWNTIPVTNDSIANFSAPGIYQVTVTDAINCTRTSSVIVTGPAIGNFDLNANLVTGNYQAGFPTRIDLDGLNNGCVPVSGDLKLKLASNVTYVSAFPVPSNIIGDTLIWNFTNLSANNLHVTPTIYVATSATAAIGDLVCFDLMITPVAGDLDSTNNFKNYCFPVMNAYDPNDKKVFPVGECNPHFIDTTQVLTYTVRFQNTGNASAVNIYVLDSLSSSLNINTVKVVGNSHAIVPQVLAGNVMKFNFNNIMLADSNANEAASHGYFIFEVSLNSNLSLGTTVNNHVGIYFDFNVPVLTNTVFNTIGNGNYVSTNTITTTSCDSITVNNQQYLTSGTFTQNLLNVNGCDSILTLDLTIKNSTQYNFSTTVCDSLVLNAQTYYNSGLFIQHLSNAVGCDSMIQLNLTIGNSTNTINQNSCGPYTWNTTTYTITGVYDQTFTNQAGCDSVVTMTLIVNNLDTSVVQTATTLTSNQNGAIYQWLDCSNGYAVIPLETGQSIFSLQGNYAVSISYGLCTDTSACFSLNSISINEYSLLSDLKVYPSPVNDVLTVQFNLQQEGLSYALTNLSGMKVLHGNVVNSNNGKFSISTSELPSGMYLLEIKYNGASKFIKVVKAD